MESLGNVVVVGNVFTHCAIVSKDLWSLYIAGQIFSSLAFCYAFYRTKCCNYC